MKFSASNSESLLLPHISKGPTGENGRCTWLNRFNTARCRLIIFLFIVFQLIYVATWYVRFQSPVVFKTNGQHEDQSVQTVVQQQQQQRKKEPHPQQQLLHNFMEKQLEQQREQQEKLRSHEKDHLFQVNTKLDKYPLVKPALSKLKQDDVGSLSKGPATPTGNTYKFNFMKTAGVPGFVNPPNKGTGSMRSALPNQKPNNAKDHPVHKQKGDPGRDMDGQTSRRLPNFLIIGAAKAGTRALINFIRLHPKVTTAKSEMHFFDQKDEYVQGLKYYSSQFPYAPPDHLLGEKTPKYLVSPEVPRRVHEMNSSIKLIATLVDPVHRVMSQYMQFVEKTGSQVAYGSFASHVLTSRGTINTAYKPISNSIYVDHFRRWSKYFPLENILVVNGSLLKTEPFNIIRDVETYLGLPHMVGKDRFHYNATRGFYCAVDLNGRERCLSKSKGRKHDPIDPALYRKLVMFYEPYNKQLYKLLSRDFGWPTVASLNSKS